MRPQRCRSLARGDGQDLLPEARFVLLVFGREADALAEQATFPCEKIADVAVHNPTKLKREIDTVFAWAA